jgi:hypothetical protein
LRALGDCIGELGLLFVVFVARRVGEKTISPARRFNNDWTKVSAQPVQVLRARSPILSSNRFALMHMKIRGPVCLASWRCIPKPSQTKRPVSGSASALIPKGHCACPNELRDS